VKHRKPEPCLPFGDQQSQVITANPGPVIALKQKAGAPAAFHLSPSQIAEAAAAIRSWKRPAH
jgi:hypothetical protein